MAALVGALRVVLGANTAQYEAGMRRAGRTARTTGNEISRSLASAQRTAVNAFRGIAAAAGIGSAIGAATVFARYVDSAKQLEAQLRLATRESGSFAQAQEDVRRIAQSSRSDIESVGNLYATIQRNAAELNITQAESARLTETITKAFQISGATAAEAAGGLRQFLQGLQSGTLRGEELNSVLENAPRLARALADGLGVTIGQLRAMGSAGQLTGEQVTRALAGAAESIDEEFRQMPVTFDQAMTQVRNAAIVAFGAFDQGGEFSQALINFAGTGQMSFADIERYAFETGREIRSIMAGLSNVFGPMGDGAANVFEFIRNEARGLARAIADTLGALDTITQGGMEGVRNALPPFMRGSIPRGTNMRRDFEAEYMPRLNNAGIGRAFRENMDFYSGRTTSSSRARSSGGGGGGGGRRRASGGGSSARPRTETRTAELEDYMANPWVHGRSIAEMEADAQQLQEWLARSEESMTDLTASIPNIGAMLTVEEQERITSFAEGFRRDIAGGLAEAIVYGRNLGDVLVNTFKRAAAAALEAGIFDLLTGQGFGGQKGGGGFLNWIGAAFGSFRGTGNGGGIVPGFASGGSFMLGGIPGVDKNMLSLNGAPIARVSRGETIGVGRGGMGSRMEIVPSPYFDVVVDGRVVKTGAPLVAAGSAEARVGAQIDMRRRARRMLG